MERQIRLRARGQIQELGPSMLVRAALPNPDIEYVSPFILVHHIQPALVEHGAYHIGVPAHPHKGFITFTYMLDGEFEHRDSAGGHGLIGSGGAQWMMTGSGIVHEEMIGKSFARKGGNLEMLQIWINIPAADKVKDPWYKIMAPGDLPLIPETDQKSYLQVLAGSYQGVISPVQVSSPLFIYRVHLAPGAQITIRDIDDQYNLFGYITSGEMAFGPGKIIVNDGETILFSNLGDTLIPGNPGREAADLFLFGGKPITEPMVAMGPFVMNTQAEISQAYRDYQLGKFGHLPVP
ncbi:MAG TPA: pirin family protein [Chitinophagaceae bacterium]|nr:pirin family protein [Chitinophagaceae bacterium]